MKNTALLVGVIIILGGVAWFLFNSVPVAQAPVKGGEDSSQIDPSPAVIDGGPEDVDLPGTDNKPPVSSFADCVAAGNLVMESYPRQCRHDRELFVEDVPPVSAPPQSEVITCTPESKLAEVCTMEYAPVCGLVQVQCITTPCNPVPETFSNGCAACAQGNVISYTQGECSL